MSDPHRRLIYTDEAAALTGRKEATIRGWILLGWLTPQGTGRNGQNLYYEADVLEAERRARQRDKERHEKR